MQTVEEMKEIADIWARERDEWKDKATVLQKMLDMIHELSEHDNLLPEELRNRFARIYSLSARK